MRLEIQLKTHDEEKQIADLLRELGVQIEEGYGHITFDLSKPHKPGEIDIFLRIADRLGVKPVKVGDPVEGFRSLYKSIEQMHVDYEAALLRGTANPLPPSLEHLRGVEARIENLKAENERLKNRVKQLEDELDNAIKTLEKIAEIVQPYVPEVDP